MQRILPFPNIYGQKYILADVRSLSDVTLSFGCFGGVEILKQVLIELMLPLVGERKFQIHFNF